MKRKTSRKSKASRKSSTKKNSRAARFVATLKNLVVTEKAAFSAFKRAKRACEKTLRPFRRAWLKAEVRRMTHEVRKP